ncbi:methyltransferase domain-containing protein [Christiangramia sediminicola]|uniref:Methyltransferase domain-containing protein n=1 Tax=Christiangramia sediminicola TaxID=3073267 RepID=A0ABU1EQI9_9FLAO|nr:methyltransferase domain-containing protein [Christiangramia sp. SM2212]MDR5590282.1 methyltransferase domain-containing protein [Christiangramia sp. SM2212]
MFRIDTSKRTDESEIMDDFELQGRELDRTLKDLENINSWLGGNQITINGIKKLLPDTKATIRIVDIGCGNGAILRKISDWAKSNSYNFELIGVDANPYAIEIARNLSIEYKNVEFQELNIFSEVFKDMKFDVILCTLTLHHFKDRQIVELLNQLIDQAEYGVVINDLHRTRMAYILFQAFCAVFVSNEIARKDGLISILRGFKKDDIIEFARKIKGSHEVSWKWAFRYQWIIRQNNNL